MLSFCLRTYDTLGCIPLNLNWDGLVPMWHCISILVSPRLLSPPIWSALSRCLHKTTLYGLCMSGGGTPCYTHIIWSSGNTPARHKKSRMHTLIHICLPRSLLLSFIFYSKVISGNKKIGQSSQSDKREGRRARVNVCLCVCAVKDWGRICVLTRFSPPPLPASPAVSRGAL